MTFKLHTPRKRFGQNFLQDPTIINRILSALHPQDSDIVVEIGPGLGALTVPLLKSIPHLEVIEIDRDLAATLEKTYENTGKITVHQADALTFDFTKLIKNPEQKLRIVGNLPYNISTPLLFHLLNFCPHIQDMHFMLQHEVIERLTAAPNCKAYGRLGIMVQYYCQTAALFPVPPAAFRPAPKVNSGFIRLVPHAMPSCLALNIKQLRSVTTLAFNQRRKTIQNSLKSSLAEADFITLNINPQLRAEQLTMDEFVRIANFLEAKQ
jgi:16S rRNA (adenine1518-N6/adenine1519-N6)-dimethyltransferase